MLRFAAPGTDEWSRPADMPTTSWIDMVGTGENTGKVIGAERIKPAYQQVAEQLRQLILTGELAPGEQLPVESEMASMFGVSRSTVREALRVLTSQSLVRTVRGVGGGSFVAQPDPEHMSSFLQTSLGLLSGTDQVALSELLEARELLEVPATRLAAERANPEQIETLRESVERRLLPSRDFAASRDVHSAILLVAGNRLLSVMAEPVYNVLALRFLPPELPHGYREKIVEDHAAIVAAIEARDADAAGRLMKEHLDMVRPVYREQPERE